MSTNNDPALGVPSNLVLERLKQSVFTVAHAVCERTIHHRATTLGQLAALALVAVNLLQMLALPIVAQFGYGPDAVSVGQIISMKSFILGSSWMHFAWGYSLVVVLAWSLLGGLFYLHSTLANGPLTRTWPMVVVRLLITLLVQAGFVPVVHVLLTPFSCTEMKLVHISEMQCHDGAHVLVLITSVVTCVPFVAASLAIKLLVHESDPNAVDVMSMSTGYGAAFSGFATCLTIIATLVAHRLPTLMTLFACVSYVYLAIWASLHLPYYHSALNTVSVATYSTLAFLCVGATISTALDNDYTFSNVWLALFIVPVALGVLGPRLQMRRIHKRLAAIRPRMLDELAIYHGQVATPSVTPATPVRIRNKEVVKQRRATITKLADQAQDIRFRTAELPLGQDEDDVFDDKFDPDMDNSTPFEGMAPYEVELLVRAELARPGNTDTRKRRRRFGRSTGAVPTTEAVEHVVYIFAAAMDEFAEDAVDIAHVKIEYARFLQVYTADVNLATGALEGALRERPTIEGAFQVFTRIRRLQKKRQSQNTDTERTMNQVVMVEYTKRLRLALHAHGKALDYMTKLLSTINRHRGSAQFESDSMAERLGLLIQSMATAAATADERYKRLLITNPESPGLGQVYRRFCKDVLKNQEMAAQVAVSTSHDETGSVGTGSIGTGSVGSAGTAGSVSDRARTFAPKESSKEVAAMDRRFQLGTFMLLLIAGGMFAVTHYFVVEADYKLDTLQLIGNLRMHTVESAIAVRSAALMHDAGVDYSAFGNTTVEHMAEEKDELRRAFDDVVDSSVQSLWDAPDLTVREYSKDNQWYTISVNMLYLGNVLLADTVDFVGSPSNYHDSKLFRFVTDNAVPVAVGRLQQLMLAVDDSGYDRVVVFQWVQAALLIVLGCTLVTLGVCVFGRALSRVQNIKRGVVEIAANLPPLTLARMRRNTQRGVTFVRRARIKAEQAVNQGGDEVAERGVGDVKGFTYDAELEGASLPQREWQHDAPAARSDGAAYDGYEVKAESPVEAPLLAEVANSSFLGSERSNAPLLQLPAGAHVSKNSLRSSDSKDSAVHFVSFKRHMPSSTSVAIDGEDAKATPSHALAQRFNRAGSTSGVVASPPANASASNGRCPVAHGNMLTEDSGAPVSPRKPTTPPSAPAASHPSLSPRIPTGAASGATGGGATAVSAAEASSQPMSASSSGRCPVAHGQKNLAARTRASSASTTSSAHSGQEAAVVDAPSGAVGGVCPVSHQASSGKHGGAGCPAASHTVQGTATLRRRAIRANSARSNGDAASEGAASDDGGVTRVSFASPPPSGETMQVPDVAHILQATPGAIVCTDAIGTILYANPAFTALTGYTVEEALGKNVTILQPEDLAERHDDIMRRVVDGGTPRVIGKAGRQLAVIPKSGEDRPMLLALGRLDVEDTTYFVADIADISQDVKGNDGEQHEEEEQSQGRSNLLGMLRVCGALLLVALLQGVNMWYGSTSMLTSVQHASEVNYASRLQALSSLLTYACREAAIGDGELWTPAEAGAFMREHLEEFTAVRFGLRYGDNTRRLIGALGRDPVHDALLFDAITVDGVIVQGLDALLAFMERDVDACIRRFEDGVHSVGPRYHALESLREWADVEAMHTGVFAGMLKQSENLFLEEAHAENNGVLLVDRLVSVFNCILVLFLYVFVFRVMVRGLLAQARRTEQFLFIIPEELGAAGPLKKYFTRIRR